MTELNRSPIPSSDASKKLSSSFRLLNLFDIEQFPPLWRESLARVAKPRVLISAFLATSALYCFVIGRDRYTSVSEFVIQQAAPLEGTAASVLAGSAAAPQILTSLVDGQYLQVYLESSDVKKRLFPDSKKFEKVYRPRFLILGLVCMPIARARTAEFLENSCLLHHNQ